MMQKELEAGTKLKIFSRNTNGAENSLQENPSLSMGTALASALEVEKCHFTVGLARAVPQESRVLLTRVM